MTPPFPIFIFVLMFYLALHEHESVVANWRQRRTRQKTKHMQARLIELPGKIYVSNLNIESVQVRERDAKEQKDGNGQWAMRVTYTNAGGEEAYWEWTRKDKAEAERLRDAVVLAMNEAGK